MSGGSMNFEFLFREEPVESPMVRPAKKDWAGCEKPPL